MSYVVCDDEMASCACFLEKRHEGAHKCVAQCGGSWDDDGRPLTFPLGKYVGPVQQREWTA